MGRSALWYARHNGAKECAMILLNNGVSPDFGLIPTTKSSIDSITTNGGNESITDHGGNTGHGGNATTVSLAKLRRQSDLIGLMNQNGAFKPINRAVNDRAVDAFNALPTSNI